MIGFGVLTPLQRRPYLVCTKRNNSAILHATSSVNLFTQQERRFSWKLLFKLRIFNSCCVFKGHLNGPLPFSLHSSDVRKCTIGLNKHLFYLFCSHATIQDESRETAGNCNLAALGILGCFFSCYYKIVELAPHCRLGHRRLLWADRRTLLYTIPVALTAIVHAHLLT